jgi:glycosyltransferase involved in cell wall biosynthesis
MPRFSILLPVHNRERYLRQAIDSVLAQTFTDYEFFAIDDGSTDSSLEILRSYGDRVRVLQQRNQGPEVARNSAASLAQGEYLVFLDSDDFFFPFALDTFEQVIRNFDSPAVILGSLEFFDERKGQRAQMPTAQPIEVFHYRDYLSKTRPLGTNCIVIRKTVFDMVGGLRNSTAKTFHGDDTNLLLKAGTYGDCVVIVKPYTSAYRLHKENSTKNVRAIAEALLWVANRERSGAYGGPQRRWDRYAYIGGRSASWAFNYCWRGGKKLLALKLMAGNAPMIATAVLRKFLRNFRSLPGPIRLEAMAGALGSVPARGDAVGPELLPVNAGLNLEPRAAGLELRTLPKSPDANTPSGVPASWERA